jgi:outer membrane receptor protein involved in Fe transport
MSSNLNIRQAVKLAVGAAGASAASLAYMPTALAANTAVGPNAETASSTDSLQEIIVTGSRVRRVDVETADPVLVLDQSTIAQSGAVTLGDLIDRIPSIAGASMNPSLNNGGGFGESNIELRGLNATRTLILIDGRRINLAGSVGAVDVNQIPINYIDHVDVLKEGAGAIYGSDAIAGVVNFVTRKNVDGFELSGDWGETSKHDTKHHSLGAIWGTNTDKFNVEVGFNYNEQDPLNMGQRKWSQLALYLYSGTLSKGGSSRVPGGRIVLPAGSALAAQFNCSSGSVTLISGAAGTSLNDYRCFNNSTDKFNFQPFNLNVTPQERASMFSKVNYKINDSLEVYGAAIYNHTHSAAQLAPLPFDAVADQVVISKDNIYNPFGIDFGGGSGDNPGYFLRMTALGNRFSNNVSNSVISNFGVKGSILDTGWNFDGNLSYNRLDQVSDTTGYVLSSAFTNAVGPSFINSAGTPTCGTPATPIANCTPANVFNLSAPSQVAALNSIAASFTTDNVSISKTATLDANGPVWKGGLFGAGDWLASAGLSYTDLQGSFTVSTIDQAQPPDFLACGIPGNVCNGNSAASYNFKEGYVELFAPILKDLPGVKSLNIDVGDRYSKYSLFGNTNRSEFKVEYRPVSDVLVRGTYAQIFRAPTINNISLAPAGNAPALNDICVGFRGAATAAYPNLPDACVGVPTDGSFKEPQNQVQGLLTSNTNLKPELGNVKTFGFVYDSSLLKGFSMSVDWWDYSVNNLLTQLDPNYAIQQCAITGAPQFCSLIKRFPITSPDAGLIQVFDQPIANLGQLITNGVDFSIKYTLPTDFMGQFQFTVDETHVMTYKNTPAPGAVTQEIAGTYNKQFGFYAKDRGTLGLGWSGWDANALLTARYIGGVNIPFTNATFNSDGTFNSFLGWHLGSVIYYDLTAGYTIKATNTSLRAGMLNIADKLPPIAGINSFFVGGSVTDVLTYDTIGRRFFVGFTQKF